jgi:hypothetical protein
MMPYDLSAQANAHVALRGGFVIIGTLVSVAGVFFNLKDIHDLIKQERLRTLIESLEKIAGIHVKTAIEELEAMRGSTRPEQECSRAIGHLKLAANGLIASQERRPVLRRLLAAESERESRKDVSLQITNCYLMIAGLYQSQRNIPLAKKYGTKAREAFEGYAAIVQTELSGGIADGYVYTWSNDQAGGSFIRDDKRAEINAYKQRFGVSSDQEVFWHLASEKLDETRTQLFAWLDRL